MSPAQRTTAIATAVLLLHGGGLWALQSGMLRRAVELVVPVELLSQIIEPPKPIPPKVESPPPPPPPPKQIPKLQVTEQVKPQQPAPRPLAPQPVAIADPAPAPNAPTGVATPQPPAPPIAAPIAPPAPITPPPAPPAPPPAPPAPVKVDLPSSDADYLNNPKPSYPQASKRLGEQGTVVVRVLIGADGSAQKAELKTSSGFERLDQAAINTVLKWRFVPGKRGGVPETMWFNVPLNFVLE